MCLRRSRVIAAVPVDHMARVRRDDGDARGLGKERPLGVRNEDGAGKDGEGFHAGGIGLRWSAKVVKQVHREEQDPDRAHFGGVWCGCGCACGGCVDEKKGFK